MLVDRRPVFFIYLLHAIVYINSVVLDISDLGPVSALWASNFGSQAPFLCGEGAGLVGPWCGHPRASCLITDLFARALNVQIPGEVISLHINNYSCPVPHFYYSPYLLTSL